MIATSGRAQAIPHRRTINFTGDQPRLFMAINSNHAYKSMLKRSERFAIWITERIGSIGFFFIIFLWTVCWMLWNVFAPAGTRFDPYPAFVLWLFISNMVQIFLMPLIMVGQNLQSKHAEVRAENDYKVNVRAEQEIAEMRRELLEIKMLLLQGKTK